MFQTLTHLGEELHLDFITLGVVQYGSGHDDKEGGTGQTAAETLRATNCSVVMVKSTSFELDEDKHVYVLATDHSEAAQSAFALVVRRLARPGKDEVHVIYASSVVGYTSKLNMYEGLLQEAGIAGSVTFQSLQGSETVPSAIMSFAKTKEADFIVMGISGYRYGSQKIGSISMQVCKDVRCTCILVKDPREVADHRRLKGSKEATSVEAKTE